MFLEQKCPYWEERNLVLDRTGLNLSKGKDGMFQSLTSLDTANKYFTLNAIHMSILAKP